MGRRFTEGDLAEMWERLRDGELPTTVARSMGRFPSAIYAVQRVTGGVRPPARQRPKSVLTLVEREEISRGF